jgi:hypothetical protein
MVVNNTNPFFGNCFSMTLVIRSYPGALRGFRFLTCRPTSLRESSRDSVVGKATSYGLDN